MTKPNPHLNIAPADMRKAIDAALIGIMGEISETLAGIDCSLRALALIAREGVPGLGPDTLNEVTELLADGEGAESETD